jgi:hypothetical protein
MFSSIETFKGITGGRVAGIPLKMVLRPYKVTFQGKAATQYGVSLEYRAGTAKALKQTLAEQALDFCLAGREPQKQLAGYAPAGQGQPEPIDIPAAAIADEFAPGQDAPEEQPAVQVHTPEDDELGGPSALDACWEEPDLNEPYEPAERISQAEVTQFYQLCKQKGMLDPYILDQVAAAGFSAIHEITVDAFPGFMDWAKQWKPQGQGTLL